MILFSVTLSKVRNITALIFVRTSVIYRTIFQIMPLKEKQRATQRVARSKEMNIFQNIEVRTCVHTKDMTKIHRSSYPRIILLFSHFPFDLVGWLLLLLLPRHAIHLWFTKFRVSMAMSAYVLPFCAHMWECVSVCSEYVIAFYVAMIMRKIVWELDTDSATFHMLLLLLLGLLVVDRRHKQNPFHSPAPIWLQHK